jgi:hypothetical protein
MSRTLLAIYLKNLRTKGFNFRQGPSGARSFILAGSKRSPHPFLTFPS